jgi:hypothetical protein
MCLVESFERQSQLLKDLESLLLRKFPFFLDVLSKCSSITKFIHQIVVIGSSEHLKEFDDVRMCDFAEDVDFVIGKFSQLGSLLEFISVHYFDRIEQLRLFVLGPVDITVLS